MVLDHNKALCAAFLCMAVLALAQGHAFGHDSRAAVLRVGSRHNLEESIGGVMESAGYQVAYVGFDDLCDSSVINANSLDLLVLTDGSSLPSASGEVIENYLRGGGDIIALNTPLWRKPLLRIGSRWIEREEYERETASVLPDNVLFDFSSTRLNEWERLTDHPQNPTSHTVSADGPDGIQALHVLISDQQGWDTFRSPKLDNPFPEGHSLTVFSAKGDEATRMLSVEWMEKDGSRWIAVVPLWSEWRRFILQPSDFKFWHSVPNRGGPNDRFDPTNAERLTIGLAFSHTGPHPGRKEYWVGPIGTSASTAEYEQYLSSKRCPVLDTLSPAYKLFDCSGVEELYTRDDQTVIHTEATLPLPKVIRSPHPRPTGHGFDKQREWRFIPLMEATARDSSLGQPTLRWRGNPATLLVHADGPYKGGVWASFGIDDLDWYAYSQVLALISQIASRMRDPVWILDGGANHYTYFDGQEGSAGLRIANLSDKRQSDIHASVAVRDDAGNDVTGKEWLLTLSPREVKEVWVSWTAMAGKGAKHRSRDAQYTASACVTRGDRVLDIVESQAWVWLPTIRRDFVTASGGQFLRGGKRWRPHGINYMPSSGIASEDRDYFEHWLGARSYDPQIVQRDLDHIKDIGFNAVSIFICDSVMKDQNLLDLLRRLDELGIKANLSLRPGTPMDFDHQWPLIRPIIEYYRLSENDTVFAYDLAWEPMFNKYEDRRIWDGRWEEWIVERYGSVENAEQDWEFPAPRDAAGKVTNPSREQIEKYGDWHRMVAAYRRFLDTLLYEKYSVARGAIREIDPNHSVSFRMSNAGDPTFDWEGRVPYDWPYLAAAVDILEPEAYGRVGDWERVKPGRFTREYARLCGPDKPMIWSEMGVSAWEKDRMESGPQQQAFQAQFYRDFYRMMIESAADGVFFWWYPGGFRVDENSDYGIINPDGSDRPVTKVIRELGPLFTEGPDAKPIDHWIEIDRDKHPWGLVAVYQEVKDDFWGAIEQGKTPGLRTAGTGTTSANCPMLAVGNTPCNGTNPPKYLDAFFDLIEVEIEPGIWRAVANKQVKRGEKAIRIRATLTNLGDATLLSPRRHTGIGGVYLVAECAGRTTRVPLPVDALRHQQVCVEAALPAIGLSNDADIVLYLKSLGRTAFGQQVDLRIVADE